MRVPTLRQARDPGLLSVVDCVVILANATDPSSEHELGALSEAMGSYHLGGLILTAEDLEPGNAFCRIPPDASADEIWGRLATMQRYRPVLQNMESQLSVMQRLGKRLNQQFVEVDQELRLASRLQRDFLPRSFPELGEIRFTALFRPATWVSGDVYDVRRLDENSVSFYLADAVGHGVAAGLLTMFIRQAVVGKRVDPTGYHLIPCDDVLTELNNRLAEQELPNCQFVTACYGVVDTAKNIVTFARGGHPHPVHVRADGSAEEVKTIGGLLGIMPGESFPSMRVHLDPGDKLIVYSDGLEDTIVSRKDRERGVGHFTPLFEEISRLSGREFIAHLSAQLDRSEGSLQPIDDQSCLIIERAAT